LEITTKVVPFVDSKNKGRTAKTVAGLEREARTRKRPLQRKVDRQQRFTDYRKGKRKHIRMGKKRKGCRAPENSKKQNCGFTYRRRGSGEPVTWATSVDTHKGPREQKKTIMHGDGDCWRTKKKKGGGDPGRTRHSGMGRN